MSIRSFHVPPNRNWGGATAFSLDFDGENIYISGNYASQKASFGGVSSACYWIVNSNNPSGKHYPLENGVSSDAFAIAIRYGQPISVGWYMDEHKIIPAKWVESNFDLLDPTHLAGIILCSSIYHPTEIG
jgi:hypothetical protein